MRLKLKGGNYFFAYLIQKLCVFYFLTVLSVNGQNTCSPSASNDGIFVGISTLTSGMIKPGINTYSVANGIVQSLTPNGAVFDPKKLQISHCFENFISTIYYEMNDFSFHSLLFNGTQIKFLFLWNNANSTDISISLNFQFLLVYGRQEFLMGSFVIDTVQFLLSNISISNMVNFSRVIPFNDYSSVISIPNNNSVMNVNLYVVGMRYLGQNVSLKVGNETYDKNQSKLSFSINLQNSNELYLIHLSYIIFDKNYLSTYFKMFFSWNELVNQSQVDYWIKGVKQINFKGFQTGNILTGEFYFYKINRLQCMEGCQQCISNDNCLKSNGTVVNQSQCFICPTGSLFNSSTTKCQLVSSCSVNEILSNNQCVCKLGYFRIGSDCGQCPSNSVYNSSTKLCECGNGTYYDFLTKKCITPCSALEIYNPMNKSCDCLNGLYRIGSNCGKCSSGYLYNQSTQSCMLLCGANKVIINLKCQCIQGYVIIQGNCSKCPSSTIYNSLTQTCQFNCTGNRKIVNGKCVCNDGLYQIGNQCGVCPQGSVYDSYLKKCYTTTVTCKQNQVLINNTCTCNGPYANSVCQPCPSSLLWNATQSQCILNCPNNSYYSSSFNACVCNSGFYVIGNKCDVCPTGTVYDFASQTCQNGQNCTGLHEIYYLGLCICDAGYFRINESCGVCASGTIYNETIFDCVSNCGLNQIYNNSTASCVCNQANGYYKINGSCQKCPSGAIYNTSTLKCEITCPTGQINTNGICSCPTGYYLIGNTCGLCDIGTVYNSATLKCDKFCPDPNGYYQNGKCLCYPPYVVVNITLCQQCVNGTTYDLSSLSCKNTTITPSNSNITCNSTSHIKTLNQTTGQYYCACNQANKYYFIYDQCATCQMFTIYNPITQSCELDTASLLSSIVSYNPNYTPFTVTTTTTPATNISTSIAQTANSSSNCLLKDNKILYNGVCKCISTAILVNNICMICPANSTPNSQQTACACIQGYFLNFNNVCTKNTSLISSTSNSQSKVSTNPSCQINQIWNKTECICVENYYKIDGVCTMCPQLTYFNGSACTCQYGYYPSAMISSNMPASCLKCDSSCSSCSGPNQNQCISCVNISHNLSNGTCTPLSCDIGSYLKTYSNQNQCQKCSSYCASCDSSISCNKCVDGFTTSTLNITQSLTIKICTQICGDGKRFQLNCDDNNTVSGDGCSKQCVVQSGWTCVGGTSTSKDTCSVIDPSLKSIISITSATISKGSIIQNVRISYLPDYFLKNQCLQCNKTLKVTVTQAKIIPDTIKVSFIQSSKYQFSVQFKFNGILSIPPFKFGVQLNPDYKDYFSVWDMNQFYQASIDPAQLSLKTPEDYLRKDDIMA